MRLIRARVQNYRSVIDSGLFEIENLKTILVGPNEAGKTAVLKALQQLNPPSDIPKFNALRDYPRSKYSSMTRDQVELKNIEVVRGYFSLDATDMANAPERIRDKKLEYCFYRNLDNSRMHFIVGADFPKYSDVKEKLLRLVAHLDRAVQAGEPKSYTEKITTLGPVNTNLDIISAWKFQKHNSKSSNICCRYSEAT